ncbi:MAG: hypothetical protein H6Q17_384 [Bacteroidetes bacterium]|nr:hypothetical protein [Bacteroidota bacterium]
MKEIDDLPEFDDDEAISFILKYIPQELNAKITEDDVAYILDVIYDFYESNGLIEEDSTEEASIDEEDMLKFVMKAIKKDKVINLSEEEVQILLNGEFEYGKSIGIYDEE